MTPLRLTASDQSIAWSADYKAFGEVSVSGDISNNLRFPGQWSDGESELYYNHIRYYNSQAGRYISIDPILYIFFRQQGFHIYTYVKNNPLINIDIYGLFCIPWFPATKQDAIEYLGDPYGVRLAWPACAIYRPKLRYYVMWEKRRQLCCFEEDEKCKKGSKKCEIKVLDENWQYVGRTDPVRIGAERIVTGFIGDLGNGKMCLPFEKDAGPIKVLGQGPGFPTPNPPITPQPSWVK